jgi:hypothetical protein
MTEMITVGNASIRVVSLLSVCVRRGSQGKGDTKNMGTTKDSIWCTEIWPFGTFFCCFSPFHYLCMIKTLFDNLQHISVSQNRWFGTKFLTFKSGAGLSRGINWTRWILNL